VEGHTIAGANQAPGFAVAGAPELPVTLAAIVDASVSAEVVTVPLKVGEAVHQPLFIGFPDGQFQPTASLTRAEAAAVVARINQLPAAGPGTASYTDVPASHWAHGYISRATAGGYMSGSEGQFHPDAPLSRAELVVLLLRLRALPGCDEGRLGVRLGRGGFADGASFPDGWSGGVPDSVSA
jgi:hypothetical protein